MIAKIETKTVQGQKRDLTAAEIEAISGGLNPQPLPPRWSLLALQSFNVRTIAALKFANFFVR